MISVVFTVFAAGILFTVNCLVSALCDTCDIPEEKRARLFRIVNIGITALLLTSYIEWLIDFKQPM